MKRILKNKHNKTGNYIVYIDKNLNSIKMMLPKSSPRGIYAPQGVEPGGTISMSNGQRFDVWTKDELKKLEYYDSLRERSQILDSWDERSLAEFNKERIKENDVDLSSPLFCEYCGLKIENESLNCKNCGLEIKINKNYIDLPM